MVALSRDITSMITSATFELNSSGIRVVHVSLTSQFSLESDDRLSSTLAPLGAE